MVVLVRNKSHTGQSESEAIVRKLESEVATYITQERDHAHPPVTHAQGRTFVTTSVRVTSRPEMQLRPPERNSRRFRRPFDISRDAVSFALASPLAV